MLKKLSLFKMQYT